MALKPGTVKTDSKTKNVYKVKLQVRRTEKQLKNKNASMVTIPSAVVQSENLSVQRKRKRQRFKAKL